MLLHSRPRLLGDAVVLALVLQRAMHGDLALVQVVAHVSWGHLDLIASPAKIAVLEQDDGKFRLLLRVLHMRRALGREAALHHHRRRRHRWRAGRKAASHPEGARARSDGVTERRGCGAVRGDTEPKAHRHRCYSLRARHCGATAGAAGCDGG